MAAVTHHDSPLDTVPAGAPGLRRELKLTDAAAFSVGLVGPVGAMALLGAGAVGILGRAGLLAFIFALVGVSLVAYGFVRLSRHIAHTGSVYGLVGLTLGPRAGFIAGWSLLGAYIAIGAGSVIEIGLFGGAFLRGTGILQTNEWIVIALVVFAIVAVLSFLQVHVITRSLLVSELIGAVLVTALSVVVIVRLLIGDAPGDQSLNLDVFSLPGGTGVGTIASAAVFGFLAFAGFEGAAALGEETQSPKTEIPRAIKIAILVVGAFYLFNMAAQSWGFGTDGKGVDAFLNAESPYGNLAKLYVGALLADALNLAASLSLFAILLGTVAAAARILFALARDAGSAGGGGLARINAAGAPVVALLVVLGIVGGIIVGQRLAGSAVLNATFYALTVGTLCLLVAYVLATVGAIRFLFLGRERRAPGWQIAVPVAAVGLVGYTIYKNVFGLSAPYDRFPYLVAAWLIVGGAIVALSPGMAGRVSAGLAQSGAPSEAEPEAARR